MATLSKRELDIANQIKAQGGTREDFENVLRQVRKEKPELFEAKEEVKIEETPEGLQAEERITAEIQEKEPGIDPKIAASKARQQLAEEGIEEQPGRIATFLKKRKESIEETFGEEGLAGEGVERIIETKKIAEEGKPFKAALVGTEGVFQVAGGTIEELFGTALDVIGEFGVKPALEQLDPDTLETLRKVSSVPVEFVGDLASSDTANAVGELIDKIPENLRNDFKAGLNLFGLKYSKVKGKNILQKTDKLKSKITPAGTKAARLEKVRLNEKLIRDNARLLTGAGEKVEKQALKDFGKLVSKNKSQLKGVKDFDGLAIRVENVGTRDINVLNKGLEGITKTFKPKGVKETLLEMKNNLGKINFKTADKNTLNGLLKKFNTDGLTLSEINGVKKLINKYTRGWTKSGLEGAGLKAESVRDKYTEVMKFIENTAARNNVKNVKELNNSWKTSNEFANLLNKQAFKAGKKALEEELFEPGLFKKAINTLKEINPLSGAETQQIKILSLEKKLDKLLDNISLGFENTKTLQNPGVMENIFNITGGTGLNKAVKQ